MQCHTCGQPVMRVKFGRRRPPHYCSGACRQRAYRDRVARSRAEELAELAEERVS